MARRFQQELRLEDLKPTFKKIDTHLLAKNQIVKVTVLGGIAVLHYQFRTGSTNDIDIAQKSPDAERFVEACKELGIDAQIVSQTTTVDFDDADKDRIFTGDALTVESIRPIDLIKSKLERFWKQDPEDIYSIIDATHLSYDGFATLFREMLVDYVGRQDTLKTSALIVVQTKYPDQSVDFTRTFRIK